MFLRAKTRRKEGKEHRDWSLVEHRRVADGRVVQRQVLDLGEINDAQKTAWCRMIEVVNEDAGASVQVALCPEDRPAPMLDCDVIQVRLSGLRLCRPRQWGACWLMRARWGPLRLDDVWHPRLPPSRKGTRGLNVLKPLVCYRLVDPGSAWRLPRHWFDHSAIGDLLGEDCASAHSHTLYRGLDTLIAHKRALFSSLQERWMFRCLARRPDQHLVRVRSAGAWQAPRRRQPRQTPRLCAGRHCPDRHPRRRSVGLRGAARPSQRQDDPERLPRQDRGAIGQGGAGVDHGSRHPDRGVIGADA